MFHPLQPPSAQPGRLHQALEQHHAHRAMMPPAPAPQPSLTRTPGDGTNAPGKWTAAEKAEDYRQIIQKYSLAGSSEINFFCATASPARGALVPAGCQQGRSQDLFCDGLCPRAWEKISHTFGVSFSSRTTPPAVNHTTCWAACSVVFQYQAAAC